MDPNTTSKQNSLSHNAIKSREADQRSAKQSFFLEFLFGFYKMVFGPLLVALSGHASHQCRFHPSCSSYAKECFENRNMLAALSLSFWRVLRCNPWFTSKVYFDYPPQQRRGNL